MLSLEKAERKPGKLTPPAGIFLFFFLIYLFILTDYSNVSETLGVITCMTIGLCC